LSFFVHVEINTSEAIKICETSQNILLKYPSVYGHCIYHKHSWLSAFYIIIEVEFCFWYFFKL